MIQLRIVPVTPFEQNCSIVWCDKTMRGAVVDPGGDLERIRAMADKLGVKIEKLLITHGHIDHAGGTAILARELGVPVEGPQEEDRFWIAGMPQQSKMFGFPDVEAFEPDRWLHDGDTVTVGEESFRVIHTPGHTPGHVVFFHADARLAIVGDVLFAGSIGRTDFPKGDQATLIHSIREKLFPLGDDITFLPGHGPTSTFGDERKNNPYVGDYA
ncbi:MBL fold metallo-hydrolase [Aromatoleum toluolicum]|uniref:MBL fold metallo-hydrolase n=1 Tax=Aromatoleum toluolicum TaxID=90060 RepID=A0ABX1NH76_9RHOO|nr:MBL fold metallo-hydrolase [Aromatoleum toluolicum]NMF98664.1 MBL fold metallo-hydrolase [Aromatoleum toluolicum]